MDTNSSKEKAARVILQDLGTYPLLLSNHVLHGLMLADRRIDYYLYRIDNEAAATLCWIYKRNGFPPLTSLSIQDSLEN